MIALNNYGFHSLVFRVLRCCIEIQVSRMYEGTWRYYEIQTIGLDGVE